MFRNPATQELVIAYRGSADVGDIFSSSDASADWLQNNFAIAAGVFGPQFFAAYHVYKAIADNPDYAGYEISLTGHSALTTTAVMNEVENGYEDLPAGFDVIGPPEGSTDCEIPAKHNTQTRHGDDVFPERRAA